MVLTKNPEALRQHGADAPFPGRFLCPLLELAQKVAQTQRGQHQASGDQADNSFTGH
jgi:hypothetical protein